MFFRVGVPLFRVRVPAWFYLGAWFQYQLIEADVGLYSAAAHRGGVAFRVITEADKPLHGVPCRWLSSASNCFG
jgi:hypothetical protein